ncbi:MAG: YIP1 family protein [Clostridia bacterium]|nr:YIP1 family protein [Clostridia bacterium]MBR3680958.1 YIP1 family protein [Clostridia bacterium]
MKNRIFKILVLTLAFVLIFGGVTAFAANPYQTYTYSIDGIPLESPDAYDVHRAVSIADMGLLDPAFGGKSLGESTDIVTDDAGDVYISDKANNRIVILDKNYKAKKILSEFKDKVSGQIESFSGPRGVYITESNELEESRIYVCDTGNKRIVVFDRDYNHVRTINCPTNPLLTVEKFSPISIAVDKYGRIFVVSGTSYEGVVVLSSKGDFTGYIGAQKVSSTLLQQIWKAFQTDEQKQSAVQNLSVPYNSITVDSDGFVYVTSDQVDSKKQFAAIKSKAPDFSPVKKLNSTGAQILNRNGFFDPGGEVDVFNASEVSKIRDIALGENGTWTILDNTALGKTRRIRLFTYDQDGNLLFAFGDSGSQIGNGSDFKALTYQKVYNEDKDSYESRIIVLDNSSAGYQLVVYTPTDYCDKLMEALESQNNNEYSESIGYWQEVLQRNSNFDLAYIGIGKALFSQGEYKEAYEILQNAYETVYASKAYVEMRKQFIRNNILWLLPLLLILIVAAVKFLGYAKKKNKATTLKVGRKTYWEELLFAFHLVFHPFDGFWDLKHEKRGSVRAASTIFGLTILAFFYNGIGKGYLFNPKGNESSIFTALLSVGIPVLLWAVSNWCLTTLFDGEGSFKDIYIATCYSLAPLPLFLVASTILSNVLVTTEGKIVTLVTTIGLIWTIILLFFGMLVTHDYSISKNFITILGTVLAMAIIMFLVLLFGSLMMKMISFVVSLVKEIANRL